MQHKGPGGLMGHMYNRKLEQAQQVGLRCIEKHVFCSGANIYGHTYGTGGQGMCSTSLSRSNVVSAMSVGSSWFMNCTCNHYFPAFVLARIHPKAARGHVYI